MAFPAFDELYARIRALPESLTGEVLEPGVLRTTPRPGKPHRQVAKRCARSLDRFDRNVGGTGWWIEDEAEIRFEVFEAVGGRAVFAESAKDDEVRVLPPFDGELAVGPSWPDAQ